MTLKNLISRWKKAGEVSQIFFYPIKACGVIKCQDIECKFEGLQNGQIFDKTFMIVNEGEIIGEDSFKNLHQISPKLDKNFMTLSAPGMMDLKIDVERLNNVKPTRQILWNGIVETVDAGEEIAKWLSRFLIQEDFGLRLIYFPLNSTSSSENYFLSLIYGLFQRNNFTSGNENFSLICESSVNDLCSNKKNKLQNEFEPNFIVRGPSAFDENQWKWVKIGDQVHFRNLNQQKRLQLQSSEDKDAGETEKFVPEHIKLLRSIAKFCKRDVKPSKGIFLRLKHPGKVKVGDPIYVEE